MNELNTKINNHCAGLVVRKDLVKEVKGNAIVPSYVLEYLLGQYCATDNEENIRNGIEIVKDILQKHYVHRSEAGLIKSNIKEKGLYKVIDKISVSLNDKTDSYEAELSNLGVNKILVSSATVKAHPKLLVSKVWCIADVEYDYTDEQGRSPWILSSIKPIQISQFDLGAFKELRSSFTTDDWIDLLIQSIGFDPEKFGKRSKLIQLLRLVPFCERNYNLIELGPKGTGKSHVFSEFSPHGILVSGGEISVPKLFVNNASGKIGLVGYWDCIAFDEFAGKQKTVDKALVDIMKNYMANKTFSRGVEPISAEASMVFVGNTQDTLKHMLAHSDLFSELPAKFHDSAFLDRIHSYIPGWEVSIIRGEMFSNGYGFVVDYLAEILRDLRNVDYSQNYSKYFTLSSSISTRDKDGINKTFSGMMKLIYPNEEATPEEVEELLIFAMEGRKRVKDQLMRIDSTYNEVDFSYTDMDNIKKDITTLEEKAYPDIYHPNSTKEPSTAEEKIEEIPNTEKETTTKVFEEGHKQYDENQTNVSYDMLFAEYLTGAKRIILTDPYIRLYYQFRNLMEFIETIIKANNLDERIDLEVITSRDDFKSESQEENFEAISKEANCAGINLTWKIENANTIHARHIITDTGWKISLDRGLDIFQNYDMNDGFSLTNRMQTYRLCKNFEITYLRNKQLK